MANDIYKYLIQYNQLYGSELFINNQFNGKLKFQSNNLSDYYNSIKNCLDGNWGFTKNNFVYGEGNLEADIVFVGGPFEKQNNVEVFPFLGESGKLFDKILSAINMKRKDIYLFNVVKSNFDNQHSQNSEFEKCIKYINNQLNIIKPKVIVCLGKIIAEIFLNKKISLSDLRLKVHTYKNVDLLVTHNPINLLIDSSLKKDTWEDFKKLKRDYIDVKDS